MHKRTALHGLAAATLTLGLGLVGPQAFAADPIKIGLILPMTGQQATTGRQVEAAVKLYMAQNNPVINGRKVEVIVKDDATVPDTTRRLAQELVVQDKVVALAGFGITPAAMATAPIATQSKTPMVVMAAATSAITEASPYVVRTSFTLPQASVAIAEWANKNGIKKVVSLVSDYGLGLVTEPVLKLATSFARRHKAPLTADSRHALLGLLAEHRLSRLAAPAQIPLFAPVVAATFPSEAPGFVFKCPLQLTDPLVQWRAIAPAAAVTESVSFVFLLIQNPQVRLVCSVVNV